MMPSDLEIDPDEPTYCKCHQVSFGEMIACDNEDVNIISLSSYLYLCPYLYPNTLQLL